MDGPRVGDAFGALLLECLAADPAVASCSEIVERDDGFISAGDACRYFASRDQWSDLDRSVCTLARGRVLDVGSGAGRHAVPLQEDGLDVTALDTSPGCVEVCRRRGVRSVFAGSVVDLSEQRPEERFDTVLLMGNNLGLLGSHANAPEFLGAVQRIMSPGAMLIGTGLNPYATDAEVHLRYHERNRARGRHPGQLRIRVRHRALATPWFDYLFTSPDELGQLVGGNGWRLAEVQPSAENYAAIIQPPASVRRSKD